MGQTSHIKARRRFILGAMSLVQRVTVDVKCSKYSGSISARLGVLPSVIRNCPSPGWMLSR